MKDIGFQGEQGDTWCQITSSTLEEQRIYWSAKAFIL